MKARRVEDEDGAFWHHEGKFRCPNCAAVVDCHSPAPGEEDLATPSSGDLNGCLYCGELSIIVVSPMGVVTLREITPQERAAAERTHPDSVAQIKQMADSMKRARFYRGRSSAGWN